MSEPSEEWDKAYTDGGLAPWDIGRPQQAFLTLAGRGTLTGSVLDAGCGTGEHTLLAASHGADARGVDLSAVAIDRARAKAAARGLTVRFDHGDILELPLPHAGFDTVIDSGLFHSFDDEDRARYCGVLARVTRPGGLVCLMCFSDAQPGDWGPRRVRRDEIVAAFCAGWTIEHLEPDTFEVARIAQAPTVRAWLALIRRS